MTRAYSPGKPLVFSHIPKTAGTSLGAALEQVLKPEVTVRGIDTALFGGYDDINAVSPVLRPGIFLTPDELPANAGLVAAHIAPATTQERFPGADHITVLRTPQVRLLSQWLHSRGLTELSLRHWGASADAFRAGRKPLKDYLRNDMVAPSVDNTITRFLAWPHPALKRREFISEADDDALVEAAIARLESFAHVNLVENSDFMADLSAWLGAELPATQLNERTSVPPQWRPDLAAELDNESRALLDHRCRLDVRVWDHVAARVMPDWEPEVVRVHAFERAVNRYDEMLLRPYEASPLRRTAEKVFEVKAALPATLASAADQAQQVRRLVPVKAVPSLVARRLDRLWENEDFRRGQEREMAALLDASERAGEVPELARAYTEHMLTRAFMRWHPRVVTRQRVKGIEHLTGRDRSRPAILSFMHHHWYDGLFGSLVNAGADPMKIVLTEAIAGPNAGAVWTQHVRVASRGGTFLHAEAGTQELAAQLQPGVVMALAPDFPGRTPVTFLGKQVLAPFGTPRLATLTNSPILLATHRRDAEGAYIQVDAPLEPGDFADPADLLQEILRRHSEAVLAWPEAIESPSARFGKVEA